MDVSYGSENVSFEGLSFECCSAGFGRGADLHSDISNREQCRKVGESKKMLNRMYDQRTY